MKIHHHKSHRAFTLVEGLVVVAVILFLLFLVLPAFQSPKKRRHSTQMNCGNNLMQVGQAVRMWQGDNNDKYPMNVPVALDGARELIATGNVVACFQIMSNELATPAVLLCPSDDLHVRATNFDDFTRTNVSYFLALNASESDPHAILSGDDNLLPDGRPVSPGIIDLSTHQTTWSTNRHPDGGNILLGDGSVQAVKQMGLTSPVGTFFHTNRIVVP